jgi:hypothetical protein
VTKEREGRGSDCNCKCDCRCKSKCKRSGEGSRDTGRCGGGGYGRMGPKYEKDRVVCTLQIDRCLGWNELGFSD